MADPVHDNLAEALLAAQAEFQLVPLDKTNPHFRSKYATLGAVMDATFPALRKHGLVVSQLMQGDKLRTMLMHGASGENITADHPLPAGLNPQQLGSAITYARRYSLAAMLCVVGEEDDDGNGAQSASQARGRQEEARQSPKPRQDDRPPHDPETGEVDDAVVSAKTKDQFINGIKTLIVSAKDLERLNHVMHANKAALDRLQKADKREWDTIIHAANLRKEQLERGEAPLDDEIPF